MESLRFPCLLEFGDCVSFQTSMILLGRWADGVCDPEPGRTVTMDPLVAMAMSSSSQAADALGVKAPGEDRVSPGMKSSNYLRNKPQTQRDISDTVGPQDHLGAKSSLSTGN